MTKDIWELLENLYEEVSKMIVGQDELKRDIMIALLSGGHILLEGAPGLAKTRTASTFAHAMDLPFQRIQFTPDLLPSDIVGAKIYDPKAKTFEVKKGPLFGSIILADEINRAPSKVQSALLQAMEEREITIGDETFSLPHPFMVIATQNPFEQEGTYHLPEAQLDRFLLKTYVTYPNQDEEKQILSDAYERDHQKTQKILTKKDIKHLQEFVENVEVSEAIYDYITDIVFASRNAEDFPDILYGASPRASLALLRASKALAFLHGRDFIIPEDVKTLAYPILRHRIILNYDAMARGISPDEMISQILQSVSVA